MKIRARTIIEMLGAPEEYIKKTLKDYVENKLKADKEIEILKADYVEPEKQSDSMFSVFVELEILFKDMPKLLDFCFDSLPSSVDILEPLDLNLDAKTFSDFLNDLQARIHEVEMVVKSVRAQNKILDKNATAVFRNFIGYLVRDSGKTVEEMAKFIGMDEKKLQPFVNVLVSEGKIKKEGDKYSHI